MKLSAVLLLASAASALRLPVQQRGAHTARQSRRGVLVAAPLGVFAALSAPAAHAQTTKERIKEEMYAKVAVREEADKIAALPINKLKAVRASLAKSPDLLEQEQWAELRDSLALSGLSLSKLIKDSKFSEVATSKSLVLVAQLRKDLVPADKYAYAEQMAGLPTGALSGYCAPGVVPRDEPGACKVSPVGDKTPALNAIKAGLATFDKIIQVCS